MYCHAPTDSASDPHLDGNYSNILGAVRRENKPNFNVTPDDLLACKAIQELVYNHLTMVGKIAKEVAGEVLKEQMEAVEQRVKANLEKIEKFTQNANHTTITTSLSVHQTIKSSPSLTSLCEANNEELDGDGNDNLSKTNVPFQDHDQSLLSSNNNNNNDNNNNNVSTTKQDPIPAISSSSPSSSPPPPSATITTTSLTSAGGSHNSITRSVSLPVSTTTSSPIVIGAGSVIPIVSLQNMFIDTSETQKLFLRRFVTTQVSVLFHSSFFYFFIRNIL